MGKDRRLIRWTAILGFITLLIAVTMIMIFPQKAELQEGFNTPVLAFQFAESEDDIPYLLGDSKLSKENRKAMKDGHYWDMAFPFAYAGFFILLLMQVICQGNKFALFGMPMALAIVPLDIYENIALLAILQSIENSVLLTPSLFTAATISAWLKWGAIGVTTWVLAICYWQQKQYLFAALAMFNAASTLLAIILHHQAHYLELMAFSIAPFIFVIFISQVVALNSNK